MSDKISTSVSGPSDLHLALVQPDFRAASAAAETQTFDPVATATVTASSDIVTSRVQSPAPRAPSPLLIACGTTGPCGRRHFALGPSHYI